MTRPTLPLALTQDGSGKPTLSLGGVEITNYVAADGLSIDYGYGDGYALPVVTIVFGPGSLNLDLNVRLLERLLEAARASG